MLGRNNSSWLFVAKRSVLSITAAFALIASSSSVQAQWNLVDDFEGLNAGDRVAGTNGGSGISTWDDEGSVAGFYTAEVDPNDASNLAMQLRGDASNQHLRGQLAGSNVIAAGNTGTVYYRFRTPDIAGQGGATDHVFGLTDNPAITNFNFKAGLRNTVPAGVNNLDARNGSSYESLGLLEDATWYSMWMVATNTNPGVHELYLQGGTGAFATQTKLATAAPDDVFDFRINSANPILNVYFRGAGNANGNEFSHLYFDDIWVNSSARDLSVPGSAAIPEPSSVALLVSGMGMFLVRRRRR